MIEIFRDVKVDWLGKRKLYLAISGSVMLLGLISLVAKHGFRYGVDFKGGTIVQVRFHQKPDIEKIRQLLRENGAPLNEEGVEAYAASVSEKIGPFKITMNLEVRVTEAIAPIQLKAAIKGADSMALNRITGSMQVALNPASSGTQMHFEASIEILGKLATLGAVPIRRRTTQAFAEFAQNIQGQFKKERS